MTEKTAEKIIDISSFIITKSADIVALYAVTFGSALIIKEGFDAAGEQVGNGKAKVLGTVCALGGAGTAMYVDRKLSPVIRNKISQFIYTFVED